MLTVKQGIEYYPIELLDDTPYGYGVKNLWLGQLVDDETGAVKYAPMIEEVHEIVKGTVEEVLNQLVYSPTYESDMGDWKVVEMFSSLDRARKYAREVFPEIDLREEIIADRLRNTKFY